MQFHVDEQHQEEAIHLSFIEKASERYSIPAAGASTCKGAFGHFICQRLSFPDLVIGYDLFFIRERVRLRPFSPQPLLPLWYMLRNSFTATLPDHGDVALHEGQFQLLHLPPAAHTVELPPGVYHLFHLCPSETLLQNLTAEYPVLNELLRMKAAHTSGVITRHPLVIPKNACLLIDNIIQCRSSGYTARIAIEAWAKQLLLTSLNTVMDSYSRHTVLINHRDIEQFNTIIAFLNNNLDERITVGFLARKFSISPTRLKQVFKQVSGNTLKDYIQQQKMEKASVLLKSGVSVNETAMRTGYTLINNFTRAFKKYTGIAPGEFRERGLNRD